MVRKILMMLRVIRWVLLLVVMVVIFVLTGRVRVALN